MTKKNILIVLTWFRFTWDMSVTRKKNHKNYKDLYVWGAFDIELSYAEVLTTVFLEMTYGFMMPIIFIPSLLQIIVLYYRDKYLSKRSAQN